MKKVLILVFALFLAGCFKYYDQPVFTYFPPIDQLYFKCEKCGSYDGGIYGKGPLNHYRSEKAKKCHHDWKPITDEQFAIEVNERFNIDWNKEIPFFQRLQKYVDSK